MEDVAYVCDDWQEVRRPELPPPRARTTWFDPRRWLRRALLLALRCRYSERTPYRQLRALVLTSVAAAATAAAVVLVLLR